MRLYAPVSVLVLGLATVLMPPKASAQFVSVSGQKLSQCGRNFVICSGHQAYSLSEIESGALQIPVIPFFPSEIVVVNDTGAAITQLQFTVTTYQILDSFVQCQINSSARSMFDGCTTEIVSPATSRNPFAPVTIQFTYTTAIPEGAYFDIASLSFMPGTFLAASSNADSGSGTGTASY